MLVALKIPCPSSPRSWGIWSQWLPLAWIHHLWWFLHLTEGRASQMPGPALNSVAGEDKEVLSKSPVSHKKINK